MSLRPGVLPFQWLRHAAEEGWITAPVQALDASQLQPASLDLRLGAVAYRIRSSFLPGHEPVEQPLPQCSNVGMSISFRSSKG